MSFKGIGVDLVEIVRIEEILAQNNEQFMKNTFTRLEVEYCASYKDSSPHFAGTFAAKEAVRKATGVFGKLSDVEIRHDTSGKPEVWIGGAKDSSLHISISHTSTTACACVVFE